MTSTYEQYDKLAFCTISLHFGESMSNTTSYNSYKDYIFLLTTLIQNLNFSLINQSIHPHSHPVQYFINKNSQKFI